jgi:deoxyribonuclease-4
MISGGVSKKNKKTIKSDDLPRLLYGSHINIKDIRESIYYDMSCVQIFLSSPKTFMLSRLSISSQRSISKILKKNIAVYVHSRYVINLARDKSYPKYINGINVAIDDINLSSKLGCSGVVFHVGKSVDMDVNLALNNMLNNIKIIIDNTREYNGVFILETSSGAGTELCYKLEHLGEFFKHIPRKYKQHIRFCIDTAHIWACGYNITTFDGMLDYINTFNTLIGWKYVTLIHLNDSGVLCNAKKDVHANITEGYIWNNNTDGLDLLLLICQLTNKHIVLETPKCRDGDFAEFDIFNNLTNKHKFYNQQIVDFANKLN